MALVLALAAGLLLLGRVFRVPWGPQAALLGILFGAVALIQMTLPQGHALRAATGGSLANWGILAGLGALAGGYALLLRHLRARAAPTEPPAGQGTFSAAELERYARHIVLRELGGPGQKKLKGARVLVVGAGGLGSPALLYMAAAGVGTIGVVDDDEVSLSNLQRQVIHTDERQGMAKVFSAQIAMREINPHVTVRPYRRRLDAETAEALFADYDLVLDGSDNFETRYLVNASCVATRTPLIAAAITQWEGQISLYDPARGAPCYACVFPREPAEGLAPSCAEAGVIGALPGVVGAMMAMEAIKEITGAGESLRGRLMLYDALHGENRIVRVARRADCAVCGGI
ncbi:molybdopterin biosynthesis protein [Maritimibacter sp. 55A14]|uniref:HesA/MoeB/ThiF family protein n=1 Tax=Maritimibacter sp. 55A14 TaxID=2174844 RepID=UPI000D6041E4|nr:HesA/MoeB/ThiF family protein [Maritimibacter sp. 55A14]PWE31170.1 molybdopterin biosynthesis protein [Maritimibacter sp. 55A14]